MNQFTILIIYILDQIVHHIIWNTVSIVLPLPTKFPPSSIGHSSNTQLMVMKAKRGTLAMIGFISREADPPCTVHSPTTIASRPSLPATKKPILFYPINIAKTPRPSQEREAALWDHMPSNNKKAFRQRAFNSSRKYHRIQPTPPRSATLRKKSVGKNRRKQ